MFRVSVTSCAVLGAIVTDALGAKLQVVLVGRFEQVSATVPVNPSLGVNTSVTLVEPPAVMERFFESGTMLKVGCVGFVVVVLIAGQTAPIAAASTEPSPVALS